MRYHNITKEDMLNGDGLRTVLWLAGCSHACPGCQNPVTWDVKGGLPFDEEAKQELFEALAPSWISGVTFSGGDPLHWQNRKEVGSLIEEIHEKFPEKTSKKHFQIRQSGCIQDFCGKTSWIFRF